MSGIVLPCVPIYAGHPDFPGFQDLSRGTTARGSKGPEFHMYKLFT